MQNCDFSAVELMVCCCSNASSVHLEDKEMVEIKKIYEINIFKYSVLWYIGIIIKQSIKKQRNKKTWRSAQYVFNQN